MATTDPFLSKTSVLGLAERVALSPQCLTYQKQLQILT